MALPRPQVALVQIELGAASRASRRSEGVLWVQAQLTDNSWLLYPRLPADRRLRVRHLVQRARNAGQFVLTLGGYHPTSTATATRSCRASASPWTRRRRPSSIKGESLLRADLRGDHGGRAVRGLAPSFGPAWAHLVLGADGIVYFDPFRLRGHRLRLDRRRRHDRRLDRRDHDLDLDLRPRVDVSTGPQFHGKATFVGRPGRPDGRVRRRERPPTGARLGVVRRQVPRGGRAGAAHVLTAIARQRARAAGRRPAPRGAPEPGRQRREPVPGAARVRADDDQHRPLRSSALDRRNGAVARPRRSVSASRRCGRRRRPDARAELSDLQRRRRDRATRSRADALQPGSSRSACGARPLTERQPQGADGRRRRGGRPARAASEANIPAGTGRRSTTARSRPARATAPAAVRRPRRAAPRRPRRRDRRCAATVAARSTAATTLDGRAPSCSPIGAQAASAGRRRRAGPARAPRRRSSARWRGPAVEPRAPPSRSPRRAGTGRPVALGQAAAVSRRCSARCRSPEAGGPGRTRRRAHDRRPGGRGAHPDDAAPDRRRAGGVPTRGSPPQLADRGARGDAARQLGQADRARLRSAPLSRPRRRRDRSGAGPGRSPAGSASASPARKLRAWARPDGIALAAGEVAILGSPDALHDVRRRRPRLRVVEGGRRCGSSRSDRRRRGHRRRRAARRRARCRCRCARRGSSRSAGAGDARRAAASPGWHAGTRLVHAGRRTLVARRTVTSTRPRPRAPRAAGRAWPARCVTAADARARLPHSSPPASPAGIDRGRHRARGRRARRRERRTRSRLASTARGGRPAPTAPSSADVRGQRQPLGRRLRAAAGAARRPIAVTRRRPR